MIVSRLLLVVTCLLLLGLVGARVIELGLARRDARRFPPPGRLVDAGARQLHLRCTGSGSPVLVLEAGAGNSSLVWERVVPDLSRVSRVCVYDRAGHGWSDPAPQPGKLETLVGDLRTVVREAAGQEPVILVGHSLGGLIVRHYRDRYPEHVVGMALLDATHPRQWHELPPEIREGALASSATLRWLARAGRFGLLRPLTDRFATLSLPDAALPAYRVTARRPASLAAFAAEIAASETLADQTTEIDDLDNLPLAVVTAGRSFEAFREVAPQWPFAAANAVWMQLQRDLLDLSTRSKQYVSSEASHWIQVDDPELVVSALADLIRTARTER